MAIPKNKIVLFQGDSITDGGRGRNEGQNDIIGQSYVYIIGAKIGFELAAEKPIIINRGTSGNRVSDMYARWNEDAISLKPDLLSILIGVNDAWRIISRLPQGAMDRFERAFRHLLEETKEVLPNTGLILCEPFILNTGATTERWSEWVEKISSYQSLVRKFSEHYGAVFVPLQKAFNEAAERVEPAYWLHDGVHPTPAGHQLIANEWLKAVQNSEWAIR
jgi:lysophospholipase L1-like esterase